MVRDLLQAGADVKVCGEGDLLTAMEGKINHKLENAPVIRKLCSPLAYAIRLNRREIALDLLQAGADLIDIKDKDLLAVEECKMDDLVEYMPTLRNLYSPLAYAIELDRLDIAWDFIKAGADLSDINEDDLPTAMDVALQREDPYVIYVLSFNGYYERHKEPILRYYASLQDAFTISQAHWDQSSHLYQQDRLSRDDFQALWTKLRD